MVTDYYQIHVTISGKLTDFDLINSEHNKYSIGMGHIQVDSGTTSCSLPIVANEEQHQWLMTHLDKNIKIRGSIRNFRIDDDRFNVIKVFDVEDWEEQEAVNEVTATCKLVGLMQKPVSKSNSHTTELYLLTNEKYDKHVRLTGISYDPDFKAPELNSVMIYRGFVETHNSWNNKKHNKKDLELVVKSVKERKQ